MYVLKVNIIIILYIYIIYIECNLLLFLMIFYIYTHWNNQIDVNDIIYCTANIFLLEYCNNINNNNILTIHFKS